MTQTIVHDGRTDAERAYDAQRDGSAYIKPEMPADASPQLKSLIAWADEEITKEQHSDPVTVKHRSSGELAWTEYRAGDVMVSQQRAGYVPPDGSPYELYIHGQDIGAPWTLAMLQKLMVDLGYLLSDDRVLAAFGADEEALTPDEEIVIDQILRMPGGRAIPIVRSHDQADRNARWVELFDHIDAMDEPARSEAIGYTKGLLNGMLMHKKPAA